MYERAQWICACVAAASCLFAGCGGSEDPGTPPGPGEPKSLRTRVLETGAAVLQRAPPIDAVDSHVHGFHFYNGRIDEQVDAHHYCATLNEDLLQCMLFDSDSPMARLVGVEYVISAKLFNGLPEAERRLWHSHVYEVKSGQLVAPGLPAPAEHALMEKLIGTYGKTWHTWHAHDDEAALPLGIPQLMMGFTADGQLDPARLTARDARLDIDSAEARARRADIAAPSIAAGADAWMQGDAVQLTDPTRQDRAPTAP